MSATNWLLERLVKDEFYIGAYTYSVPANFYLGLSKSAITKDSTYSDLDEPLGEGYARQQIPKDTGWSHETGSITVENSTLEEFNSTGDWGTIVSVFLSDTATRAAGNIYYYYNLNPPIKVVKGTKLQFPTSSLIIRRS